MTDTQDFLLPSTTGGAGKRSARGTEDDPGYVPGVEYDGHGRYKIPNPNEDPSDLYPWTRVTTLAGMLTSSEGLRVWSERAIMRGIGLRSDLRVMLAAAPDDKAVQDEVRETAKIVAEMDAPSRYGRALHRALEDSTSGAGMPAVDAGEPLGLDLQAALGCLDANGITVRAVEQLVVNEYLGYAGRLDALWEVELSDGQRVLRIGDLKSGKEVTSSGKRLQHGAQLAMYVNCTHVYDPATRTFSSLPAELDRTTGYILHVRDGVAQMHEVDLVTGWRVAKTAVLLHRQRSASIDMLPVGDPVRVEAPKLEELRTEPTGTSGPLVFAPPVDLIADTEQVEASAMAEAVARGNPGGEETAPAGEPERSPSGRKRRACSICRQPGHTAKHCPTLREASAETPGSDTPEAETPMPRPSSISELISRGIVCTCTGNHGWHVPEWAAGMKRADLTTCPECGYTSRAVLDRLVQEKELAEKYFPGGVGEQSAPGAALVEAAAMAPADTPRAPIVSPAEERGDDGSDGSDGTPPWLATPSAPLAPPTLAERVLACRSQEELGALWTAHAGEWNDELTAIASEIASRVPDRLR